MKCDELKAIKIELNNHGKPIASIQGTTSYYGISPNDTFYPQDKVDEADAVIAEKDKEIAELKKSLEQKKIAEGSVCRILWNLVDSGIIKEWHFNGEYNVLLNADDPHIQISELKTKIDKVSLKFCKQLCHNKYKRCLAMADFCSYKAWYYKYNGKEEIFYRWMKYRRVWAKLAEKFKPNN